MASYSHDSDDLTPLMTAPNAPSPNVANASEEDTPDSLAFKAFDHVATGYCWQTNVAVTGWIKFDFGAGNSHAVVKYTISVENNPFGDFTKCPKTWTLQGSNDDSNWTTLDTQTNVAAWSSAEMRTYEFANSTTYRYYKVNVTANQGGAVLNIAEIELMGASNDVDVDADITNPHITAEGFTGITAEPSISMVTAIINSSDSLNHIHVAVTNPSMSASVTRVPQIHAVATNPSMIASLTAIETVTSDVSIPMQTAYLSSGIRTEIEASIPC